jgi:hypothetical protein
MNERLGSPKPRQTPLSVFFEDSPVQLQPLRGVVSAWSPVPFPITFFLGKHIFYNTALPSPRVLFQSLRGRRGCQAAPKLR